MDALDCFVTTWLTTIDIRTKKEHCIRVHNGKLYKVNNSKYPDWTAFDNKYFRDSALSPNRGIKGMSYASYFIKLNESCDKGDLLNVSANCHQCLRREEKPLCLSCQKREENPHCLSCQRREKKSMHCLSLIICFTGFGRSIQAGLEMGRYEAVCHTGTSTGCYYFLAGTGIVIISIVHTSTSFFPIRALQVMGVIAPLQKLKRNF